MRRQARSRHIAIVSRCCCCSSDDFSPCCLHVSVWVCARVCMLSWPTHLLFPLLLSCDLHNTNTRRNNKSFLDLLTHFWRGAIKIFLLQMQILTPCIEGWRLVLYSSADLSALGVFLLSFCCAANSELGWGLLGTP